MVEVYRAEKKVNDSIIILHYSMCARANHQAGYSALYVRLGVQQEKVGTEIFTPII